jgi:hypothetical protein
MTATLCLGPIPAHLLPLDWYAGHQAWCRAAGLAHHDPGDARPIRASLDHASLDHASLVGASLDRASLVGASLVGASLDGARLVGARLVGARLDRASLDHANLDDANLDGARLDGANLDHANLDHASLDGASLVGANLVGARLDRASLDPIAEDVRALVRDYPTPEVEGLLAALREGRVDGSTYTGECACLVGTIALVRDCDVDTLARNRHRPAEQWALAIRIGDTPATNPVAALTVQWIEAELATREQVSP